MAWRKNTYSCPRLILPRRKNTYRCPWLILPRKLPVVVGWSADCWPLISSIGEPTTYQCCRSHTMARDWRREGEQNARTHSTSISVGRSSAEEMAKLNSLSLLSYSGKLYIQLYPSNPSTQICQAVMLLQWLDVTAGLTLAPVPAVAIVQ